MDILVWWKPFSLDYVDQWSLSWRENFSHCLILAGNSSGSQMDLSLQRGGISVSGVSVRRYGGWIGKDPLSRCQHVMHSQINSPLEERVSKQMQAFDNKGEHFSPLSRQSIRCLNFKLKASRSHSYLSSAPLSGSNVEQREVFRLGLIKRKHPQTEVGKANIFRVSYKSEEYDIGETKMDRLQSTEGTGEAILVDGNMQQISPWWQQFPKRWVIVLLCFSAFLLCNMDRVSNFFWCLWFQLLFMFSMSHTNPKLLVFFADILYIFILL